VSISFSDPGAQWKIQTSSSAQSMRTLAERPNRQAILRPDERGGSIFFDHRRPLGVEAGAKRISTIYIGHDPSVREPEMNRALRGLRGRVSGSPFASI
jgi:hypothetical protein